MIKCDWCSGVRVHVEIEDGTGYACRECWARGLYLTAYRHGIKWRRLAPRVLDTLTPLRVAAGVMD